MSQSRHKTTKDKPEEINVVSGLVNMKNVQLVRLPVLQKYIEFDRRNVKEYKYKEGEKHPAPIGAGYQD